ncbi:MAG TPA: DUF4845 domain-containing protein [Burkholderiales bacterium]|nr:DUF4845 domain-containing protein [Burkholderiales bacterium]
MDKQRGLTLTGLIITLGVIVFFALIGFKLLPAYLEYWTVQRIVSDIAHSPETRGGSVKDVQAAFSRRAVVDNVTSVSANDLEVSKVGEGYEISVTWSKRVPLFGNINACMDFEAKN